MARSVRHSGLALPALLAVVVAVGAATAGDAPLVTQEHSQWCWAAVSTSVLGYYGKGVTQCETADYASNGSDCCASFNYGDESHPCNKWNYMWGASNFPGVPYDGSLKGIMAHYGVTTSLVMSSLPESSAVSLIDGGRLFVMRFQWNSGAGHFLVGHGYENNGEYLNYMDPLPGHGYTRSLYTWAVSAGDHTWTHTLTVDEGTAPPPPPPIFSDDPLQPRVTPVRTVHILELREHINELRTRFGLGEWSWVDSIAPGATRIGARHVTELRDALNEVYRRAGRELPAYADAIAAGQAIKAAHIAELRAAILAIW